MPVSPTNWRNHSMQQLSPAQALVARIHAGWNLGNTLESLRRNVRPGEIVPPALAETAWGNPPVTPGLIHAVRDAAAKTGIPVNSSPFIIPVPNSTNTAPQETAAPKTIPIRLRNVDIRYSAVVHMTARYIHSEKVSAAAVYMAIQQKVPDENTPREKAVESAAGNKTGRSEAYMLFPAIYLPNSPSSPGNRYAKMQHNASIKAPLLTALIRR